MAFRARKTDRYDSTDADESAARYCQPSTAGAQKISKPRCSWDSGAGPTLTLGRRREALAVAAWHRPQRDDMSPCGHVRHAAHCSIEKPWIQTGVIAYLLW
jgi:hypothetical protein